MPIQRRDGGAQLLALRLGIGERLHVLAGKIVVPVIGTSADSDNHRGNHVD
jgi:hypothetical protein